MLAVIRHVVRRRQPRQYYLHVSNTAHACTSAWCAQHSSTASAQNSQLYFSWLSYGPNRQEVNSVDYKIYGATAAWIWVASQQNWRNQAVTGWTLEKQ